MSEHELITDGARRLAQLANEEAHRFQHEYIGTEHLLLALIRLAEEGANVFTRFNIDPQKIRRHVEQAMLPGPDAPAIENLPRTPRAKKAIEFAMTESRRLGHAYVGTEHILLGLLREECVAAVILMNFGLKLEQVRRELREPPRATAARAEKFADHPLARAFRAAIDALTREKEECIESQEFKEAAAKRDAADQIKRQLAQLIRRLEADEDPSGPSAGTS